MPSKKYTAHKREEIDKRKRSRPITKKNIFKKNKFMLPFLSIIIILLLFTSFIIVFDPFSKDEPTNPIAVIDTSIGTIKVELYKDKMPITVNNFVKLANDGFYDGLIFHRIKDDFMIQAGRQTSEGTIKTSPYGNIQFEESDIKHVDGAISMASSGEKVGGSAEFFICDGAQQGLNYKYAAFGVVIEGIDIVQTIATMPHDESLEPTPENPYLPGGGKPLTDIIIYSITIE